MRTPNLFLRLCAVVLYAFLYMPIVVVMVYSCNQARYGAGWTGFTWHWYRTVWENEAALMSVRNTIVLGLASTAIATCLGTPLGLGLGRFSFPGRRLLGWLLYVPVVIPEIVMAVAMLLFYSLVRQWFGLLELGMTTMILSHVTFQIPFVAIVVRARLAGLDPALEEAAADLGANPWQRFRFITLPLILPGIIAGAMLAFTLSLDDFVVSFFTTGPGATTLPILIYSSVKRGITPEINALSTLMVLVSVAATLAIAALQKDRTYPAS